MTVLPHSRGLPARGDPGNTAGPVPVPGVTPVVAEHGCGLASDGRDGRRSRISGRTGPTRHPAGTVVPESRHPRPRRPLAVGRATMPIGADTFP